MRQERREEEEEEETAPEQAAQKITIERDQQDALLGGELDNVMDGLSGDLFSSFPDATGTSLEDMLGRLESKNAAGGS
eukprot:1046882-Pyramimonas_sp.AAC.2